MAVGLAFSVALLACVPFRRRAPVAVFVAVSVLCLAQFAVLDRIVAGDFVALIALYTLVAYGPGTRLGAVGTACAVVGALIAAARWETSGDAVSGLEVVATTVISTLLAATLGAWRRSRRAQLAALEDRNRLLALERDQQAAVGAAIERARIARELHDVVAHSLSVIVVQADGAAAAAEQRPAAAAEALRTIGDTGRDALEQMRRLLGVLRAEDADSAALAPQPGTAELDALVAQVARAGPPARLSVEGVPRPLAAHDRRDALPPGPGSLDQRDQARRRGVARRRGAALPRRRDRAARLRRRPRGAGRRATAAGTAWWGCASASISRTARSPPARATVRGFEVHAVIPTGRVEARA